MVPYLCSIQAKDSNRCRRRVRYSLSIYAHRICSTGEWTWCGRATSEMNAFAGEAILSWAASGLVSSLQIPPAKFSNITKYAHCKHKTMAYLSVLVPYRWRYPRLRFHLRCIHVQRFHNNSWTFGSFVCNTLQILFTVHGLLVRIEFMCWHFETKRLLLKRVHNSDGFSRWWNGSLYNFSVWIVT